MSIDFELVRVRIFDLIKEADLEKCSAKSIRKILEKELQIVLDNHKDKINELINEAIVKRLQDEERAKLEPQSKEEEEREEEPLEAFVQEDGERDEDLDDEELARRLQEAENSGRARPKRAAASKVKGKRLVRRKDVTKPRKAPNNAFNRPFTLSDPLSRLLGGTKELSRPQVVKQIWAYVKERNLQDPSDKRILVCDELLLAVMRKPKISCFAMNKVLSDHLIRKEEVAGNVDKVDSDDIIDDEDEDEEDSD